MMESPENAKGEKEFGDESKGLHTSIWEKQEFECRRPRETNPCLFLGRHLKTGGARIIFCEEQNKCPTLQNVNML